MYAPMQMCVDIAPSRTLLSPTPTAASRNSIEQAGQEATDERLCKRSVRTRSEMLLLQHTFGTFNGSWYCCEVFMRSMPGRLPLGEAADGLLLTSRVQKLQTFISTKALGKQRGQSVVCPA